MIQTALWRDDTKTQSFLPEVPIEKLQISELNPRKRRDEKHIAQIAQLIANHGFDKTCAPKAVSRNGHYEVFAGGNRISAAKQAGCETVPVYLYDGYTDDEIWRLAYLDNEQAGKHAAVHFVDVWQDYAEKSKRYKSQDEMAEALGVTPPIVSWRIRCANFPVSVIQAFLTRDELNERHARELLGINQVNNRWLSTEKVCLEVVDAALKKGGIAKHFADLVAQYNALIKEADAHLAQLPDAYQVEYLAELQRAMVAARLANMPAHRPEDKSANLQTSQAQAAELLQVSPRSVASAKTVQDQVGFFRTCLPYRPPRKADL